MFTLDNTNTTIMAQLYYKRIMIWEMERHNIGKVASFVVFATPLGQWVAKSHVPKSPDTIYGY